MKAQGTSGHTLVEVMIAVTLMAIFLSAVGLLAAMVWLALQPTAWPGD